MADSKLAPNPPGLIAKLPKDIPIQNVKLPPGFQIELWATGMNNARSMTIGDKGTVFVGSRLVGNVYAVIDRGTSREVKTIARGLHRPNGVAFRNGSLYVAELSRVIRYDNIENMLDNPPAPVVVYDDLPRDEPHGWKFISIGPDGMLYVPVGAPCNICEPPASHAQIRRISLDGKQSEVVARGVRNTVGFDWHPATRELWFTDNGRDWAGEDLPHDELNRVSRTGQHFGFPYCHQGDFPDPELGKGRSCGEYTAPAAKMGPHVAALGMRFYTGNMFPAEYRNQAFIALHGSWNRTRKSGYQIVLARPQPNGSAQLTVFADGFLQGDGFWGRPVDVQQARDGSLLVSDDVAGAIYRISYRR